MVEVGDEIEMDCPNCGKSKAVVLNKAEKGKRMIMEIRCTKCNIVGRVIKIGDLGIEITDFPPIKEK